MSICISEMSLNFINFMAFSVNLSQCPLNLENLEQTYLCFIHNFNLFLQQSVLVDEVLNILKNDNNKKTRSVNALNGQDNHN